MITWIDWKELERRSGWAPLAGSGFDERFDDARQVERARTTAFSAPFDELQAEAMELRDDDVVLDACCGVGRLTVPMARRAKRVVGVDGSPRRLAAVRELAHERGLGNVETVCADWFALAPEDLPGRFDVVVACNCPALADVARLSLFSARRCIYLQSFKGPIPSMVSEDLFEGVAGAQSRWRDYTDRFCPRSSLDVSFNRLLSLGASPTVRYCDAGWRVEAATRAELYEKLRRSKPVPAQDRAVFERNVDRYTSEFEGGFVFERKHTMVMMAWDSADVRAEA